MRRLAPALVTILLALAGLAGPAGATPSDQDNDTVPNRRDACPTVAGIRSDGCPTAQWRLNDRNGPPPTDWAFGFGSLGWAPVAGDWGDLDSVGAFNRASGWWHLRSTICDCWEEIRFHFD